MPGIKKHLLLLFALLLTAFPAAAQDESKTVSAEGVAVIQNNLRDIARDAAIQDAQQRAVEQAIGTLIDSQTQVENYQVISDKILSQTKGYIKRYNITNEIVEGNLLRVVITAEVSLGKLTDDMSAVGILLGQMHKPRTMILVAEQNIGQELYAWWRGGTYAQQSDMAIVESVLMDKFTEKGFEMIDHAASAGRISVTAAYNVTDLSSSQAQTLGNQAGAEVVIVGKAFSKIQSTIGALKSAQANLVLKAVRTDTGQVLASVSTNAPAVHSNDLTAGNEALKKAAANAADQLTTKILAMYSRETGGTRSVNITVTGLNKSQFVKFKDVLKNQVRGIKEIHERSFSNGVAKISVDYKGSAQVLSDELSSKTFGDFSVDVAASTANSLELLVGPPGGTPMTAPQ
ncbi:MAG: flagellar assembly protein T N-terminal domain-containing protein [Nitrospirota bacterium]|nr:flagellar assembly protein T N-terminal domain-containing protein [Nitrospirota bacterium]